MKNRADNHNYGDLSYPDDMVSIVKNGLVPKQEPKNVIIIEAGMAGLVAGSLL